MNVDVRPIALSMADSPRKLELTPFPPLEWTEYDWWSGTADLMIGIGDLAISVSDSSADKLPSESQRNAMAYHLEHEERINGSLFEDLRKHYDRIRPDYVEFLGADATSLMPKIDDVGDLESLVFFTGLFIHPWTKSGHAFVGLQFNCEWEMEHALGVLMLKDRVVDIGYADVAFSPSRRFRTNT